ncbi:MAG: permease [Planctomycetaceae bacterium]|nr:permease [Planctomycetaceae bacterium]
MLSALFFGFLLRFLQSLVEASPFIFAGFATAAVLRRFFGPEGTRRLFGEGTRSSLVRAWLIGMLLPVCSLGVIPVARELRRAGISGGTILAFALSGPLFNPLSLLYGLTLSEPVAIISFGFCSLVIVTIVGIIWDRIFPGTSIPAPEDKAVAHGLRRVVAVAAAMGRELAGPSAAYILLGLCGVAMLGVVLPPNSLQHTFNFDNPLAPLWMTGLSIPVYATPMLAMSQLGMMFQHANSIGAAFVLLILGAGMNIGNLAWMIKEYGLRRSTVFLGLLLGVVLGLAYSVDKPLFPRDIEPANHTHAFDIYCRPFSGGEPGMIAAFTSRVERDIEPWQWRPLWFLMILAGGSVVLQLADRTRRVEQWCESGPEISAAGNRDIVIPGPVLGALALLGLVVLSTVGCFTYYPAPEDCLTAMEDARIGALSSALAMNHSETKYWAERYDDWTRKLEVGAWLRHWELSDYHRWKTRLVREKLEVLEHEVEDNERDEVRDLVSAISRSHRRMKRAFLGEF